ncbi:ribosome maturation factor RimP [Campylobacter sp.]|uniref:ribosome maturation factor RimP n=1 Tax=Campylobacter sp. TaxID=205 RepID=UPI0026DD7FE7|nr:ribosome maturation factor RimP [Campylobacter sp.]MDO4673591.1 ribosome maturation factor RimP [Campylobacter sp.]
MDYEALCREAGVEFYDHELANESGKKIFRIFITKKGGVNLDDCARLSEILSPIFDVCPPVSGEYFLEVSSPGLERKLSTLEHFQKSIGEGVKLSLEDESKICGKLLAVRGEEIELGVNGSKICIAWERIKKAKTFIEW